MEQMLAAEVSTRRGIMTTHRETAYKEFSKGLSLPLSEHYCDNSVVIPLFYPMKEEEISTVISTIKKILNV